jgi:glycosyltransferase involved in cell wall biosynthesis
MPPRVTIGLPVYNGGNYLRETLDSLLAQDHPSLEILAADNASSDDTASILASYAKADPRVRVHRHERNIGAWRNFNFVAREARAPYFLWAGAHDLWAPTYLSKCVERLEADPTVVLAYSLTGSRRPDGSEVTDVVFDRIDTRGLNALERYRRVIWDLNACSPVHGVIRKSALDRTGLFRLDVWGADHLLLAELAILGGFAQVEEVLFWLRAPHGEQTEDERKRRVARACDPDRAEELSRLPWSELHRQTLRGHMQAVAAAPFGPAKRLYARLLTMLCFHVRTLAPLVDDPRLNHLLSVAIHRSKVWKAFR